MSNAGTGKNVLTSEVEIKGNLKFAGELTFEGKLDGEINTDGTLHLGDTAVINGNINAGTIIDGAESLEQVGRRIFDKMLAVASGERSKNEITGHREFAIWRTGPML